MFAMSRKGEVDAKFVVRSLFRDGGKGRKSKPKFIC
jgi:hypothetical protein